MTTSLLLFAISWLCSNSNENLLSVRAFIVTGNSFQHQQQVQQLKSQKVDRTISISGLTAYDRSISQSNFDDTRRATLVSSLSLYPTKKKKHVLLQASLASSDIGYELIQKEYYDVVKVDLDGGRDYPIYIGTGYSDEEASTLLLQHVKGKKVLVITNDRIAPLGYLNHYTDLLKLDKNKVIETLVLPDGEEHKNMNVLGLILDKCLEMQLDRQSTLVALGGGVIGDMVGFAAAVYVRGIRFVQIPTTVMAMVDSSVGGKTGVNHPAGKNMIGSFHQPSCVFIDSATLETLPDRELASGISEIIKYGLIRDYDFFVWLESNIDALLQRDKDSIRYAVTRSCQNKAAVVKADEKEADVRATLNLGHTFGHAIENGSGYGTFLHGEAVSIGIAMAATLSERLGWITSTDVTRILTLLQRANLPINLPSHTQMTREVFLQLMSVDKKVTNGQLRLILLKGPLGNCVFTAEFDEAIMIQVIDDFIATAKTTTTTTTTLSEISLIQ